MAATAHAGRSELPDNHLKGALPSTPGMAMAEPDCAKIAQVVLFSDGFRSAEKLAGKLVLCSASPRSRTTTLACAP
jgi:dynein heavy chain 1